MEYIPLKKKKKLNQYHSNHKSTVMTTLLNKKKLELTKLVLVKMGHCHHKSYLVVSRLGYLALGYLVVSMLSYFVVSMLVVSMLGYL